MKIMNDLKTYIQIAERNWLERIYNYCEKLFIDKKIPSHDHTHHLRVWKYSKEILFTLSSSSVIDTGFIQACLLASFFHDTGLTINLGEIHGKESKEICIRYFEENKLPKPNYFEEILYAIEKHDDKDYKLDNIDPGSILSILCTADDLDAFGNIGVIRYTEIYLLRGFSLAELPNHVIKNLDKRFLNFEKVYRDFSDLYLKHKERYLLTRNFFAALQEEL